MKKETEITTIYSYDDFRQYLKDRWDLLKSQDKSLTCRSFAIKAGFSNPGFFNDVINNRRKLSKNALEKIIRVFNLSPVESDFLKLLVSYGQTRKNDKKQEIYHQIVSRRNRSSFSRINQAITKYYQDYRYPLLRNALMAYDFHGDFEEFGRFIIPQMSSTIIRKYIQDMVEWDLVRIDTHGRYIVTEKFIEPSATLKEQIRQVNREWISHATDALMNLPPQKRHISSRLLSVSTSTAKEIALRLEKARDEIWQLVKNDSEDPSCVMQLNIQYFPRTRVRDKEQS